MYSQSLKIADRKGKTLAELFGLNQPLTYKEYRLWQLYHQDDMNNPDRTDHYLMALRMQVDGLFRGSKSLNSYKIKFSSREKYIPTPEEATAMSRVNLGLRSK